MIDSLYIGASGLNSQQMNVDTISNNLANVNTPAYKKSSISFQDLMYRDVAGSGIDINGNPDVTQHFGAGVGVMQLNKLFQDGVLKQTGSPMDIAISGKGFLEVTLPDGSSAYTRSGSLQITPDGLLATSDGNPLKQMIHIPSDMKDIVIDSTGKVTVSVPNETNRIEVGQIELTNFINPAGLTPLGNNLYIPTDKAGEPVIGNAGSDSFGTISQGYVEASNVSLVDEMVSLILAQRAYEVSAKVIQASDEMLGISNNLRR
jgi:flagellar basal-body rod protein FlgG